MKVIRLAGLVLVAILAMSLVATSAASAGLYLFTKESIGALFLALTLRSVLNQGGTNIVVCEDGTGRGTVADVHLLGPFDITFTGCQSSSNSGATLCAANSVGGSTGTATTKGVILTNTLHGLLGTTLPSLLGGALVLPTTNQKFVTFQANACTIETSATGNVAGLLVANQLGHSVLETLINFIPNDITLIDTLNGRVVPEIEAFGHLATFETVAHLAWDSDVLIEV